MRWNDLALLFAVFFFLQISSDRSCNVTLQLRITTELGLLGGWACSFVFAQPRPYVTSQQQMIVTTTGLAIWGTDGAALSTELRLPKRVRQVGPLECSFPGARPEQGTVTLQKIDFLLVIGIIIVPYFFTFPVPLPNTSIEKFRVITMILNTGSPSFFNNI